MRDVCLIDDTERAAELLKPLRLEILSHLESPRSCPELAKLLGLSTQKVYYHVKVLEKAGLVGLVRERRVRGIMEGIYHAVARSYWFSPRLVKTLGGRRQAQDLVSLTYLLNMAETLHDDIGRLAGREETDRIPSLGIDGQVELGDETVRAAFLDDVRGAFQQIAEKYGQRSQTQPRNSETFRLMLACYPQEEPADGQDKPHLDGDST